METETRKMPILTKALVIAAIAAAALTAVLLLLSLPHIFREPAEPTVATREPTPPPTTQVPSEEPTEEPSEPYPTMPPPEENPYGQLDFQYNDENYLKLIEGESITGVDVSYHQGEIDWEQVKASGVEFAMIRMAYRGYGTGKIVDDTMAAEYVQGALDAGLEVGVYFFSQALNVREAEEEAEYLLQAIEGLPITMPVVYDWEHVTDPDARTANTRDRKLMTDCALAFLRKIEDAGYWPMMYFNTSQSRKYFDLGALKQYDFWLALYNDRMRFPYKIKMWQYTDSGYVPGIEGDADINVFFPDT